MTPRAPKYDPPIPMTTRALEPAWIRAAAAWMRANSSRS